MNDISFFNVEISAWLYAPVVYFIWVSTLLILKKIMFGRITKFAGKTKTQIDDVFLNALNLPLTLLIFVSGIFVLEKISPLGKNMELTKYFLIAFRATTIMAVILFLDKLRNCNILFRNRS